MSNTRLRARRPCPPHGFTLLELLVVVFIMAMLGAIAIRVFRPSVERAQTREAARILTSLLGEARAMALETQLTSGVMFTPSTDSYSSSILQLVATAPPYAGDFSSSRLQFTSPPQQAGAQYTYSVNYPAGDDPGVNLMAQAGDLLQLNNQGNFYRVEAISQGSITLSCTTARLWPPQTPNGDPGVTFKFFHMPQPTHADPVPLPTGAVVDLNASGIGSGRFTLNTLQPVMVTFSPTGQVDLVYYPCDPSVANPDPNYTRGQIATDNIYLLIGRPEGTGSSANLQDMRSMWVAIPCQSGLIVTANNTYVAPGTPSITSASDLKAARSSAATGSSIGG